MLASLAALGVTVATVAVAAGVPASAETSASDRQQAYTAAAGEFGVPVDVLLGVSYLESRWDANAGQPSTSAGYGPMHLTDAAYLAAQPVAADDTVAPEDARGDDDRPAAKAIEAPADTPDPAALQTMDVAAQLTGASKEDLRTDPAANIRGGAALLSAYQKQIEGPTGSDSDPAAWYGAVARYSGADDETAAAAFADEVYAQIAAGASRTTDDGAAVNLTAAAVNPVKSWLDRLHLRKLARPDGLECPVNLDCEWIPAPYEQYGPGAGDYGNHDLGNRPAQQKIEYIVIHDTEGTYPGVINLVQDPTYLGWHYTIRSNDGHIAQHIKAKDVGWHAGNWYVNAKSIGIEHEGFAAKGTWYTEAMYRTSSKLVRYLALRLGIPLDRQHIIGHDNVPGTTPSTVAGMHWDPGPYWDWSHYMDLLGAPIWNLGTPYGGVVTIKPNYATNQPAFTGCVTAGVLCAPHGSGSVILHTAPDASSPLLSDFYLDKGKPATMLVSDHGARAETGQQYAIADRQGDWTAIWYLGQKGWFYNPASNPAAAWSTGLVAKPKAGKTSIPVYGRAYPEAAAYPAGVPVQAQAAMTGYVLAAGQRYVVGGLNMPGEYYRAVTFDGSGPGDWTVIRGQEKYVQIQFGHRIMYVKQADVDIVPAFLP
ncbi:N-acetylmuramoyl-L-alanine amidase [Hamadaea tsunoensis]|uniref:N-acetylmuramoyl-L-alanine amidase n=1 Tax=Hamadaea tsunoensis TaxID=53368 RepID=UPI001FDFDE6F|nr:peptidoglycan recognition family protein [Hamadaea tsunoensis]